jgi:hypothetical protein
MIWTTRVQFPADARDFSLLYSVKTGYEAHSASYPMGTWGVTSLGVKRQDREADLSSLPSAEVKKGGAISPLPRESSWRGA